MASDGIEAKTTRTGLGPESALADETSTSVIEVAGVIKWFDVAKGYGFIVPDNGMADVLLHVTCLRRDGFQTAYEGARVVAEALARPKGLQAFRIISMDDSTAVHRRRCRRRAPMSRSRRRAGSNAPSSNGSTACAASAFSRAARARRTSSSTWRRCGVTA